MLLARIHEALSKKTSEKNQRQRRDKKLDEEEILKFPMTNKADEMSMESGFAQSICVSKGSG